MTPEWKVAKTYTDILYHKADGIAKVTINRPAKRNAFRPLTVAEMFDAFSDAREDPTIGVVLLTGAGPHTDGKYAFCAGGDQSVRGPRGVHRRGGRAAAQRARPPKADSLDAEGRDRARGGLRDRRRPRAPCGVRSQHRGRQRDLRPGRTEDGQLRRRVWLQLPGAGRRPEEGARDLVPLPAIQREGGARDGPGQHGGAGRRSSKPKA